MGYQILLVEDNNHKRVKIVDVIHEINNEAIVTEALSYTSGWQNLLDKSFDLVVLDMSLPTYDVTGSEPGGKFRTFGGKEIARKIKRRGIKSKFFFITQYESFNNVNGTQSLKSIEEELILEYADQCVGVIYFDSSNVIWKEKLNKMINKGLE